MSYLLNRDVCSQAVGLAIPSILALAANGITAKPAINIHIVIMDPTIPYSETGFEKAILYLCDIGENTKKYIPVANSKARISWRTGLDSLVAQQMFPALHTKGDTKWGGSVVRHGIVVAVSGLEEWADIFCSGVIADACNMFCRAQMRTILKDENVTFLGLTEIN